MKLTSVFWMLVFAVSGTGAVRAGELVPEALRPDGPVVMKPTCDCFDHGSTSIDLFGVYVSPVGGGDGDQDFQAADLKVGVVLLAPEVVLVDFDLLLFFFAHSVATVGCGAKGVN